MTEETIPLREKQSTIDPPSVIKNEAITSELEVENATYNTNVIPEDSQPNEKTVTIHVDPSASKDPNEIEDQTFTSKEDPEGINIQIIIPQSSQDDAEESHAVEL